MGKFKRERGMSLIEVLIVVSILGFVSLMVASTFSDIFSLQRQMVNRDQSNEFSASVARFLFSEGTCTTALAGQAFPVPPASPAGTKLDISLPGYLGFGTQTGPGSAVLTKHSFVASAENTTRIHELSISDKGMPAQVILSQGVKYKRYLAVVTLVVANKSDQQTQPPTKPITYVWRPSPPRTFEFPVLVDPATGLISRCFLEMQVQDACSVLGTVFDPATGKCKPMTQCIFEGYFSTNTCNPGVADCPRGALNTLTGDASCPSGVATAKQTGAYDWSYSESCGKKCTETVSVHTQYYLCLKCNP